MRGCCEMAHEIYLNSDGTINSALLREVRLTRRREYLQSATPGATARAIVLSEPFTDDNAPCMCDCHREGSCTFC